MTSRAEVPPSIVPPYGDSLFAPRRHAADLSGLRVLLVEDDDDARTLLLDVLSKFGCHVAAAASVSEALEQFAREPPALVVSDVGLPGEDGFALARRIRALSPEQGGAVPAIALTAYTTHADKERAREAGFTEHLPKPVNVRQLVDAVGALARA